jgi:hypothetical protein
MLYVSGMMYAAVVAKLSSWQGGPALDAWQLRLAFAVGGDYLSLRTGPL